MHLKRKTEAKLLICQTHGVQLFATWEKRGMLVGNLANVDATTAERQDRQDRLDRQDRQIQNT